mmetsp:Transcript_1723/g.2057  ORF Transcript_1723/g.2057 Transcript_1723/m.2057 type:complete len:116 (-) Transcript_1723:388-735(-)
MTRRALLLSAIAAVSTVSGFAPTSQYGVNRQTHLKSMTLDGQEIRGEITPLGNFILVRTKDTLAATGGGILLPDQVSVGLGETNVTLLNIQQAYSLSGIYLFGIFFCVLYGHYRA